MTKSCDTIVSLPQNEIGRPTVAGQVTLREATMRVTCAKDPELAKVLLAEPDGMLEAHGASHLWDVVSERLGEDTPSLLMDMSKVKLMTSAGVGTLIRLLTRVRNLGGAVSVYGCSDRNRTILKVVGIEPLVNLCETEEEARERLQELGVA